MWSAMAARTSEAVVSPALPMLLKTLKSESYTGLDPKGSASSPRTCMRFLCASNEACGLATGARSRSRGFEGDSGGVRGSVKAGLLENPEHTTRMQ